MKQTLFLMSSVLALPHALFITVLLISTIVIQPTVALADEVKWSAQDLAMLKTLWIEAKKPEKDLSNAVVENPVAISMGHKIFFDTRFSADGKVACASCHQPKQFFSDGLDTGQGLKKVSRNTPTIVGASRNTWFFHDGRNDSLWSQAMGPLENPLEHGGNRNQFAHIIFSEPVLRKEYALLFGAMPDISDKKRFPKHAGPVADKNAAKAWKAMNTKDQKTITDIFVNIGKVIAAYETQLQPAPSRFDNYVNALLANNSDSMKKQLSDTEVKGLRIFIGKGRCTTCHSGSMFTDKGFHNISVQPRISKKYDWGRYTGAQQVIKSPFNCRSEYNDSPMDNSVKQCDELEYIVMDRHETFGAMKTPSLRNVSRTAPYMHAGQYKTLRDVLKHYNDPPALTNRQSALFLDIDLNEEELDQLEVFLRTLDSPIAANKIWLKKPGSSFTKVRN